MIAVGIILKGAFRFGQGVDRRATGTGSWGLRALGSGGADAEPLPELGEPARGWREVRLCSNGANTAPLTGTGTVRVLKTTDGERLMSSLVLSVAIAKILGRRRSRTVLQRLLNFLYPGEDGGGFLARRQGAQKDTRRFGLPLLLLEAARGLPVRCHRLVFLCFWVGALREGGAHPPHALEVEGLLTAGRR